jgi:hypothetical protein
MHTTELDDLKQAWQSLHLTPEIQHAFTLHQLQESKRASFRRGFRPLVAGQIVQIIFGLGLALVSGSFWFDHLSVPHLAITGLLLHAYGLMMIVFAARDLVLIKRIDYSSPVVTIHKQIAELCGWHLRAGWWFAVTGCFIWTPLLLMLFYAAGLDLWLHKPQVVYCYILSSFVCLGFSYGLVRWSRRPGQEKLARRLQESSAGSAITRVQAELKELERFERE